MSCASFLRYDKITIKLELIKMEKIYIILMKANLRLFKLLGKQFGGYVFL